MDKTAHDNPRLKNHKVAVYFLTDMQRTTWSPELGKKDMDEFRRQSQALAKKASLVVIDLGQPAAENLAVTGLQALDPVAVVGRTVAFEATVKNFGRQPRTHQAVQWRVDGGAAGEQSLDIPAGGEVSAAFQRRFQTPGDHTVEVRAEGDALETDNHRYLVVPVRKSLRVLCINGRPSGEPYQGATDYLAVALASKSGRGEQNRILVDVAAESALLERDLGGYDCVFLCDVAQFTASEARMLDAYLARGGNLVFFLGPQVSADRYNRELGGGAGRLPLLPARLGPVVEKQGFSLDPLGYRHTIVRSFEGNEKAGLLTTPVSKHYHLELFKNSAARVVVAAADGDPLIVAEPIRKGRVVLVATSADLSWTYMPLWPSYVPLVQEISGLVRRRTNPAAQLRGGRRVGRFRARGRR